MTAAPTTIADTPEALTPGWLTDVLRASGLLVGASVVAVDVTPLGTGQMCDSWRLALTYEGDADAPATMVAKLPAVDPTSRTTAVTLRSYEKEVRFYQELADGLDVRTPRVHHAAIDDTGGHFVLLLEDLAPATQGDQLAGCSLPEAELALDELVRLHAPRWGDDALARLDWLHPDPAASRATGMALLPVLWSGFQERYDAHLTDAVRTAGAELFGRLGEYLEVGDGPRTVVHGDYRLDNLLFDPAGGRVAVVDWQTCTYGPAMADVAYFVGAGLLPEDRRAHEEDLVRRYHEALGAAGVAGYGWEACWRDHRRGTWAGLVMAVGASMMVERTDRGDQMFLAMASRHAQHALDLDAAAVLGG